MLTHFCFIDKIVEPGTEMCPLLLNDVWWNRSSDLHHIFNDQAIRRQLMQKCLNQTKHGTKVLTPKEWRVEWAPDGQVFYRCGYLCTHILTEISIPYLHCACNSIGVIYGGGYKWYPYPHFWTRGYHTPTFSYPFNKCEIWYPPHSRPKLRPCAYSQPQVTWCSYKSQH